MPTKLHHDAFIIDVFPNPLLLPGVAEIRVKEIDIL